MISIDKLIDIYNGWGNKEKLHPLSSADDMLRKDNLTEQQINWLVKFIKLWDMTERKELNK